VKDSFSIFTVVPCIFDTISSFYLSNYCTIRLL